MLFWLGLYLILLWVMYKDSVNESKRREVLFWQKTVKTPPPFEYPKPSLLSRLLQGNKRQIRIAGAAIFGILGVLSLIGGISKNSEASNIRKYGEGTMAQVIGRRETNDYVKGDTTQYGYLVEFTAEGKTIHGEVVTTKPLWEKNVDIYYMPGMSEDIVSVIVADRDDKPGRNDIYHGALALLLALGFFLDLLKKGNA